MVSTVVYLLFVLFFEDITFDTLKLTLSELCPLLVGRTSAQVFDRLDLDHRWVALVAVFRWPPPVTRPTTGKAVFHNYRGVEIPYTYCYFVCHHPSSKLGAANRSVHAMYLAYAILWSRALAQIVEIIFYDSLRPLPCIGF